MQFSIADDAVEVIKSISPEELEKHEEDPDQVALETSDHEQKVNHNNYQHPPQSQLGPGTLI